MPRIQTWCTYLLRSLPSPASTYIGFTNDPAKRLRQHNGELVSGARRTHKKRPWEMLLVLAGFPTQVSALQFVRGAPRPIPPPLSPHPPSHTRGKLPANRRSGRGSTPP